MEETLRLLEHSLHGEQASTDRLIEILGGELRSIAEAQLRKERPGHTLQPTALVNEAYLRLIGQTEVAWQNASHFRAIASNLMRRILIDHARRRASGKRGGNYERVCLTAAAINDRDDHDLSIGVKMARQRDQIHAIAIRQLQICHKDVRCILPKCFDPLFDARAASCKLQFTRSANCCGKCLTGGVLVFDDNNAGLTNFRFR